MRSAEEIHRLIARMSLSERRYFRLQAGQSGGRPAAHSLFLYDWLSSLPKVTGEAVHAFQAAHPDAARFMSQHLHYLRGALLRSLRQFHEQADARQLYRMHLSEVELLATKGLHADALRHLGKLERVAAQDEQTLVQIEAVELRSVLLKQARMPKLDHELEMARQEKLSLLALLQREQALGDLYNRAFAMQAGEFRVRSAEGQTRIEALLADPTLAADALPSSFQAEHLRLQTLIVCHHLLGDTSRTHAAHEATLQHWERHPKRCTEQPERYGRIIANYLASSFDADLLDGVPVQVARLRALVQGQPDSPTWRSIHYYEVMWHLQQGQYQACAELLPVVEAWIATHPQLTPVTWLLPMWYNFIVVSFVQGRWAEVLRWGRQLQTLEGTQLRREVARAVSLLVLVAHFERGDEELMHYLARSAGARIQRQEAGLRFERAVIRFLNRLAALPLAERKAGQFDRFLKELEAMALLPGEAKAPGFDELTLWARKRAAI